RSLIQVMLASQTLNGVLLPIILIVMLRLVNDRRVMGRFTNGRVSNILSYGIVIALVALTVILLITTVFPWLLGSG
ncbi:MAG: divalent metal cation transporter, partial [Anaerolineae bacterium]|nr:divalent metal cation transporter [Anaerolineae bacterium]